MAESNTLKRLCKGYTLIELLVGLLLSSMLLLAFTQLFIGVTQLVYRLKSNADHMLKANLLFDQIEFEVLGSFGQHCTGSDMPSPVVVSNQGTLQINAVDLNRLAWVEHAVLGSSIELGDAEPNDVLRSLRCFNSEVIVYGSSEARQQRIELTVCDGTQSRPCLTRQSDIEGAVYATRLIRWQLRGNRVSRFESAHPISNRGSYSTMLEPVQSFTITPITEDDELIGLALSLQYQQRHYRRYVQW